MAKLHFSEETITFFHSIYNNDSLNLKVVVIELLKKKMSYMQILQLTKQETKLGLGEAITLLGIPDISV